ncbi:MAG: glycosyltransferase [Rhodobacteraceae bacterium]|nr:MAG: glycosyltransferase [Paracoccaceae bacterium]
MDRLVLHVHDKTPGGGGVRRHVEDLRDGLPAHGWRMRSLRLARPGEPAAPEADDATAPLRFTADARPDAAARAVSSAAAAAGAVHLHLGFTALSPALVDAAADAAPLVVGLHDVAPFCPGGSRLTWPRRIPCQARVGPGCWLGFCAGQGRPRAFAAGLASLPARTAVWRRLLARAAAFLAPSRYIGALAQAAGAPEDRLLIAPHGVAWAEEPHCVEPPSAAGPTAVFVGRLDALKGAALLLEAFAAVRTPEARLVLVGDGPLRDTIAARIAAPDLAGRVRMAGAADRAGVRAALCAARVAVAPSLIPESFGLSGVEAMALGRPVVATPRGGVLDWLAPGETGLAAAPEPLALAAALDALLAQPELADRMGAAGRARAAALYTPARMLAAVAGCYDRVAA